jgi:hypothetical protein
MSSTPHLHVSVPHVEKLAEFLVLLTPIFLLTSLGTIQGGLASRTELEMEIRRCYRFAAGAAPEHDCLWIEVRINSVAQCSVVDANRSRGEKEAYRNVSIFEL